MTERNRALWRLEPKSGNGVIYGGGASGTLSVFDTIQRSIVSERVISNGWINGLGYHSEKNRIVVATSRGEIFNCDGDSLEFDQPLKSDFWFNGIKRVPGQDQFLITSAEGVVHLWDMARNELLKLPATHSDQVWDCAVAASGDLAATVGGNGEMVLWNLSKGEFSAYLSRGGYTITTVLFLNRCGLILTVDMGGGITLWGQKERHAVSRFNAHDARIWSVATSHDEKWLVTAGADGRIVTWDLATLRIFREHRISTLPTACAIDTRSGHVVVGDRNGDFLVLDGPHISAGTEVAAMPLGDLFEQNRMVAFVTRSLDGDYGRFSTRLLRALDKTSLVYVTVDVTQLPLYRQTLARISGCPLFPQLYVHERFVGGSEVAVEMVEAGVLHRLFSSPTGG